MTEYVATRWYRAPEIFFLESYTKAIDLWSVGCILAEMLSGKPLFPGRDYHHQLSIILDALGTPSLDDFYSISSHRSREYIRALPFRKKKPFSQLFEGKNPLALDLLEQLLTFNPKRRIDVEGALAHPYLESYHDPMDEPTAVPLDANFFDFDYQKDITKEELKGESTTVIDGLLLNAFTVLIFEEVTRPHQPQAPVVPETPSTPVGPSLATSTVTAPTPETMVS